MNHNIMSDQYLFHSQRQPSSVISLQSKNEYSKSLDERFQAHHLMNHCQFQQPASNSLPKDMDEAVRTASIPISDSSTRRSVAEAEMDQEEAEAEYRDYAFFSRVVNGISSKQDQFKCCYSRYENQLTLSNILRTRHEGKANMIGNLNLSSDIYFDEFGQPVRYNASPTDPAEFDDDSESGVFDMDL